MARLFFSFFMLCFLAGPAWAVGQVEACGVPDHPGVTPDSDVEFCNIYDRQFAYAEDQKQFREDLEARREAYEQPRTRALKAYKKRLKAYHGYNQ